MQPWTNKFDVFTGWWHRMFAGQNKFLPTAVRPVATGTNSVAIGPSSVASGTTSFALHGGTASGTTSVAIRGTAAGTSSIAIGTSASADTTASGIAIGTSTTSTGGGIAIGGATASNGGAVALGGGAAAALASGLRSAALSGENAVASGTHAAALAGLTNTASGNHSATVAGNGNIAAGRDAATIAGVGLVANSFGGIAIGQWNTKLPATAQTSFVATDSALVAGCGTGDAAGVRAYSFHGSFDSIWTVGGMVASGANGNTGIIKMGFTASTAFASITSASHAASRTYTIGDCGANGVFNITTGAINTGGVCYMTGGTSETANSANLTWDNANTRLGILTASPTSTLHVAGSVQTKFTAASTTLAVTEAHSRISADTTAAGFTITLPTAVGCAGRMYWVKKISVDGNTVTVATTGGQTIDGASTKAWATQWTAYGFISDGANWLLE